MSKLYRQDPNDRRGKWSDVFKSLTLVLVCYMAFRWTLWEPFVIPSGSMEQTLLVQDYVLVKKWAYGVRLPFTSQWLIGPFLPQRGDIVVFKSKVDNGTFLVKRVVGLPGDQVEMDPSGRLSINGQFMQYAEVSSDNEDYQVLRENNGRISYNVQYLKGELQDQFSKVVPDGQIFLMGDNRDNSSDSRLWGGLPVDNLLGKLVMIWLSCKDSENYSSFVCSPNDLRMDRLFRPMGDK